MKPVRFDEIAARLNIDDEEKSFIKKVAGEILEEIEKATQAGYPKEIYQAARHLLGRGKLLRAILVMLINKVYGFYGKEKALKLAAVVELLHTASLIHDDIIDGAKMRRGVEAVHKKFGVNLAILSTDLLISIAYNICADLGKRVIKMISEAGKKMSEAEALECIVENPSVEDYFRIIDGKSSELIKAACACSAMISRATKREASALGNYGRLIGNVLQIKDDILDFISNERMTGKTNPLFHGLKKVNIVEILANERGLPLDEAVKDAYRLGKELAEAALKGIAFVDSRKRRIFNEFTKFILEREF